MILRRPYAFLIKYFRIIHIIIFFLLVYVTSMANSALNFFKDYIKLNGSMEVIASNYLNISLFIFAILIVVLLVTVYFLMRYKKKPRTLYIIGIIITILSFVIFVYLFVNIKNLETGTLAGKQIRLLRDISRFNFWTLFATCIPFLIRGLGFDIKKFDFNKDLQELNITEADNEEVEVSLNIDVNKISRASNQTKRELSYYYQEFKLFINIILGVVGVIVFFIIMNKITTNRVLGENSIMSTPNFNFAVEDSYIYENKKNISDEYNYLVLKIKVKGKKSKYSLDLGDFILEGKKNDYIPTYKYYNYFSDIGQGYLKGTVLDTKEYKEYIIIYNIKDEDKKSTYIINYLGNSKKIRIKPEKVE